VGAEVVLVVVVVRLSIAIEELSELPVGRAGGRAAVSVVELDSSVSVGSSVVSDADAVTVTVVGAVIVPMLVVPGAVSVTVFSIVVVYVEPPAPPATTTVVSVSGSPVVELGASLVRPDVTVATGRIVVVVCVLAHTHPTS
jgi:hypothetical protein